MLGLPKPSLGQIATGSGDSEYPDLWRGLIMACDAGINDRTDRWTDWSGNGNHFALSNVSRSGDGLVFNGVNSSAATVSAVKYGATKQLTIVCDHTPASVSATRIMLESSVNYNSNYESYLIYREDVNNFSISHRSMVGGYCAVRYKPTDLRHVASYILDCQVNGSPDMVRLVNGNYIPYLSYPSTGESNVGLNDYILYLGARAGSSLFWPGTFHKMFMWTRLLTPQEHYQLSMGASPLQKRRRLWLFVKGVEIPPTDPDPETPSGLPDRKQRIRKSIKLVKPCIIPAIQQFSL